MSGGKFGALSDGRRVNVLHLRRPGGLEVEILTYGGIVRCLKVPGSIGLAETIVGFDTVADYENDASYQACVIGRTVNRMKGGRFRKDGRTYQVTLNEGQNHLHGGACGLTRRIWTADARSDEAGPVILRYTSPDGEEGYPGILQAKIMFSLPEPMMLEISYEAEVDASCPVDLTHHIYFNLGQDSFADIRGHRLSVKGDHVLEVDADYLATGKRLSVDDTLFDLRWPRKLSEVLEDRHSQLTRIGLNQSWVTGGGKGPVAVLSAPETGIRLELSSDQPCLQVWTGLSRDVAAGGAIALEPQGFIDAVNQKAFPDPWLAPGETYRRTSRYKFQRL